MRIMLLSCMQLDKVPRCDGSSTLACLLQVGVCTVGTVE